MLILRENTGSIDQAFPQMRIVKNKLMHLFFMFSCSRLNSIPLYFVSILSNLLMTFRSGQRERIDPVSAPQTVGFLGPGSARVEEVSHLGLGITVDTHHPEEEDGPSGE